MKQRIPQFDEYVLNESFTDVFRMDHKRVVTKLSKGSIFTTSDNEYEIVGYGDKSNAFTDFDVKDKDGKMLDMRITTMYGADVQVAPKDNHQRWDNPIAKSIMRNIVSVKLK